MRSRPKLSLYLQPGHPTPGGSLVAEAVLESRSETPIDGVVFELEGIESRFTHSSTTNNVTTTHYERHKHLALVAKTPARVLGPGEHRVSAEFALPPDLPPAFKGRYGSVEYTLRVRVDIPWWPDRRERYVVPVRLPAPVQVRAAPARFANASKGPQGKDLYIEASLDSANLELGGAIEGAVSLQNVEYANIRRVEVAFVAIDCALVQSGLERAESGRWALTIHEGKPEEGKALRFSTRAPADAPPSFRGKLLELVWELQVRAVIAWGKDVVLRSPLEMTMPAAAGAPRRRQRRVPPIGHERRTLLWEEVARKTKTVHDKEAERLTLEVTVPSATDAGGVSLAVTLEHRGDAGLFYVAALDWSDLGLDLQIAERRLLDAFRKEVEIDPEHREFAKRVIVRAREAEQARALLDERLRGTLLGFERVALDDEGCELASKGGTESAADLEAFVWRVIEVAHLLASATSRVPPPAAMANHAAAWRSFAREHGGRLFVGDMRVEDATYGGHKLGVSTRWEEGGGVDQTVVTLALTGALPEELAPEAAAQRLSAGTRARLDALRSELAAMRIGPDVVEASLAGPLEDPRAAEPVILGLSEVARELAGAGHQGPYR